MIRPRPDIDDELPVVTQEEFDKIVCNKCGDCCEQFYLVNPAEIYKEIEKIEVEIFNIYYYGYEVLAWTQEDVKKHKENLKRWTWYKDIRATGMVDISQQQIDEGYQYHTYRCTRFQRLSVDEGICTDWENRPDICSDFPYGHPMTIGFPRCSWRVKIVE